MSDREIAVVVEAPNGEAMRDPSEGVASELNKRDWMSLFALGAIPYRVLFLGGLFSLLCSSSSNCPRTSAASRIGSTL